MQPRQPPALWGDACFWSVPRGFGPAHPPGSGQNPLSWVLESCTPSMLQTWCCLHAERESKPQLTPPVQMLFPQTQFIPSASSAALVSFQGHPEAGLIPVEFISWKNYLKKSFEQGIKACREEASNCCWAWCPLQPCCCLPVCWGAMAGSPGMGRTEGVHCSIPASHEGACFWNNSALPTSS